MNLAGIAHEVVVSDADETIDGAPDYQVHTLALRKGDAVIAMMEPSEDAIVIAADTLVYIDGKVLGKPKDAQDAFDMLKKLQGRSHKVYTGVALTCTGMAGASVSFVDSADVYFRTLSDDEIWAYISTGEPFDKAGAYGVQERGAVLVDRVEGDFYTVVGLPISKVCTALMSMGFDIWGAK